MNDETTVPDSNESQNTEQQQPERVRFTPEQQVVFDRELRSGMARAAKEVRLERDTLASRVRELESKLGGPSEEVSRLSAELEAAHKTTAETKREQVIAREATRLGFFDPSIVNKLVGQNLQYDKTTKSFTVVDDSGEPRLNSALEPMSPAEFLQDFANKNSFLVRGEARGGAGSTPASQYRNTPAIPLERIFGNKSDSAAANRLAIDNPKEYKRLKQLARDQGVIRW